MQRKLTYAASEAVYNGRDKVIGQRRISEFTETLVKPHGVGKELDDGYKQMVADEAREAEALDWAEGTLFNGMPSGKLSRSNWH